MKKIINVLGKEINIDLQNYVSLTDMLKAKDGDFFISDWLRNRNTIEFLGVWEKLHNPKFNCGEFAIIKSRVGLNNYKISVKEWVLRTNAIGLKASSGRYGGTYAHKHIALAFASWISAEFQVYLVSEFDRLKEQENKNSDWNIKRTLTKINYRIHTNAIKENLIPEKISLDKIKEIYSSEAEVLNLALFGMTSKEWKEKNNLEGNMRDYANVVQLVCLSNLENLNAHFISEGIVQGERLVKLNEIAIEQMKLLVMGREMERLEK